MSDGDYTICPDCRSTRITWEELARFGTCALCTAPWIVKRDHAPHYQGAVQWVRSQKHAQRFTTKDQAAYVAGLAKVGRVVKLVAKREANGHT